LCGDVVEPKRLLHAGATCYAQGVVSTLGRWLALLAVAACGGGGSVDKGFYGVVEAEPSAPARAAPPAAAERPRLVIIRASWCPACVKTERVLFPVLDQNSDKLDVLTLDVSDDDAIRSSRELAFRAGVSDFFEQYRGVTPSIGLVSRGGRVRHYDGNPYRRESWQRAVAELIASDPPESAH
jgi:thiol-disulfide isomerase/thioredoxin